MTDTSIYSDIALRTNGAFMLGVVGPVRTGKSSFIKRFMETMVLPHMSDEYLRERTKDELPQSGSGKMITTTEPKFIPEQAVSVSFDEKSELSVRLVDCVGFMADGAAGASEDGNERMVATPWFDHEIPMSQAAEYGTQKVISEHSTIGIVITTDGSICDLPRTAYLTAEERAISELKTIGKPFLVLLNSAAPETPEVQALAQELELKYGVRCKAVNCLRMEREDFTSVLSEILEQFPLVSLGIQVPEWLEALGNEHPLMEQFIEMLAEKCKNLSVLRDCRTLCREVQETQLVSEAEFTGYSPGEGTALLRLQLPQIVYFKALSDQTGLEIHSDAELFSALKEMSSVWFEYRNLQSALQSVQDTGYGVVAPLASQIHMDSPQIVRQNGKYQVKLHANAPVIHMFRTKVETEITPSIAGSEASDDIWSFLLQGFNGDPDQLWQSNIFGKSLESLAQEGLTEKLTSLPAPAQRKLGITIERMVNEGSGGLICILL